MRADERGVCRDGRCRLSKGREGWHGPRVFAVGTDQSNGDIVLARVTAAGALDATFGTQGKAQVDLTRGTAGGALLQPDGKIVVVGTSAGKVVLLRFLANGSLDSAFGVAGRADGPAGHGKGVALRGDGKIVVVGDDSTHRIAVSSWSAAGQLDGTFGTGGVVATALGAQAGDVGVGNAIVLDAMGRMLVTGGFTPAGGASSLAVVRYTATGALDTTYNTTGSELTPITGGGRGDAIAFDGSGNILVGATGNLAGNHVVHIARFGANGGLDTTFDTDGIAAGNMGATARVTGVSACPFSLLCITTTADTGGGVLRFAANGSIASWLLDARIGAAAGMVVPTGTNDMVMAAGRPVVNARGSGVQLGLGRWSSGGLTVSGSEHLGSLDQAVALAFLDGGIAALAHHGPNGNDGARVLRLGESGLPVPDAGQIADLVPNFTKVNALVIGSDNEVYAAGRLDNNSGGVNRLFAIEQMKVGSNWGNSGNGRHTFVLFGRPGGGESLLANPGGGFYIGGWTNDIGGIPRFAFARLNAAGSTTVFDVLPFQGSVWAIARQADGKLLFAGHDDTGGRMRLAFVRTDANLFRDPTFGTVDAGPNAGLVTIDASSSAHQALFALALQPDGKILAVGATDPSTTFDLDARNLRRGAPAKLLVVRLLTDGRVDPGFGINGVVETTAGGPAALGFGVTVQPDGKILVAGRRADDDTDRGIVLRLTPSGQPDPTYGVAGVWTATVSAGWRTLLPYADGRLLLGGHVHAGITGDDVGLARLLP